ncbi:sensor histidine kinase [Cyclobacterium lianum]|nr:HAMP domain-containing sensor histidine kinase [Cyclobacterium lianum]
MEKQIFNATLVIVFLFILLLALFNLIIGNPILLGLSLFVAAELSFCYYLLRKKNKYKLAYFIFGLSIYPIMSLGFFYNDGIQGPTIYILLLAHLVILSISTRGGLVFWTMVNGLFFFTLYYVGIFHDDWIPEMYSSNELIFLDHILTYLTALAGITILVSTLKKFYRSQKNKVKEKTNELIQLNRSLTKTSAQKDKIITIISHDLKNPLQSIMQTLELMKNGDLPPDEVEFLHEELLKITSRTYSMMENILDWSSFELKSQSMRVKEIRLKSLLEDTTEIFRAIARQKQITIDLTYKKDPLVKIETDRLLLIYRNLVQNAIKFTPSGGTVTVEVNGSGKWVNISIQDNGIGISEERLQKIFEQDIKSTYGTAQEKGTGMGLHLCFQNAHKLGGQIEVKSKENNGSVFVLTIPNGLD